MAGARRLVGGTRAWGAAIGRCCARPRPEAAAPPPPAAEDVAVSTAVEPTLR